MDVILVSCETDDLSTPTQLGKNLTMRGLIIGTEAHKMPALISTLLHMKDNAPSPRFRVRMLVR